MQKEQGQWTVVVDPFYQSPYAYNGRNWIGYDSVESVAVKGRFIEENGLGGGMVWNISMDDFKDICGNGTFPLIRSIRSSMD